MGAILSMKEQNGVITGHQWSLELNLDKIEVMGKYIHVTFDIEKE